MSAGVLTKESDELSSLRMAVRTKPSVFQDQFGIWRLYDVSTKVATIHIPPSSIDIVDLWGRIRIGDMVCPAPLILCSENGDEQFVATQKDIFVLLKLKVHSDIIQCQLLPASGSSLQFAFYNLSRRWILNSLIEKYG